MEQNQIPWSYQAPETMYSQSQYNSPFAGNVSSYFRRPTRIVKSSSRNNSPVHSARRKTTSTIPISRTRSVHDRRQPHISQQYHTQQSVRPVSWHPNSDASFNFSAPDLLQAPVSHTYYQPYPFFGTTTANGLVTPTSYPIADEPQIQELITPLEELSARGQMQTYGFEGLNQQSWLLQDPPKSQGYSMDSMFPQNHAQQPWVWNHQTSMLDVPTAPSSPDFLPIQGGIEASPLNLNTHNLLGPTTNDGEELVGMGLYDSPADVQSSSLLFGGGLAKRQLKLEESFEPATDTGEEADDEEDAESDEEELVAASQQEAYNNQFPEYEEASIPTSTLAGQSFLFDAGQETQSANYADMSFMVPSGYQPHYQAYGWV